ncbi:hypothetical protein DPX16_19228 [Anabarilius grahami]|uniref:Uncharacterized protein n=1 Tax=Anabarilius grahami TaxID=495550 RepID=A0A3N0YZI1_ANAGA|nr:hypothetical protein DPX16_19228 [Anabarilius grahami]
MLSNTEKELIVQIWDKMIPVAEEIGSEALLRYQRQFRAFALPREENRPGFSRRCEEHKHTCYYVGTTKQVPCLSTANTSYKLQGVSVELIQYTSSGSFQIRDIM